MLFSSGANLNPGFAPGSTWSTSGLGNRFFRVSFTAIPEPTSLALCGLGLLGVLVCGRRRTGE
jgi:hypothetical protein